MAVNHFKKHQQFIFNLAAPAEELTKFVEGYLDDKLNTHLVTLDREQPSFVRWINAENFEKEVLRGSHTDCVIEVIKDHCPACFISKFNTNMLSRKMANQGLLQKVPIFRMKINNQIPYLGDLPHTPLHIYVKKNEKNEIVALKLLDSPLPQKKTDNFLKQVEDLTGIAGLTKHVKLDVIAQRTKFLNIQDLEQNLDIEFDAKPGYVTVTAKREKEKSK